MALTTTEEGVAQQVLPPEGGQGSGGKAIFRFGEPEGTLDRRELSDYFEVWHNGRWYEPPLPLGRLAKVFNAAPYHRSSVGLRVNMLVGQMVPSRQLDIEDFERFSLDFVQMGNAYLEYVPNASNGLARAQHAPAVHMRVGRDVGQYWFVNPAKGVEFEFRPGTVFHLQQPDVAQEVYGLPEWISALQSALLNENATIFRRRYYLNGAHAGFVFYLSEPLADQATAEAMADQIEAGRGAGNFKNVFVYIPKGKKDGIQIMPIADVTAKDEFNAIKTISRDDMLAAHRTPPQLLGIVPQNSGGFGSVSSAKDTFYETEIVPIMQRMLRMNAFFRQPVLAFRDYVCADGAVIKQDGSKIAGSGKV
ncbi:phage portal protein [Novosphingobium umbonatum]|uniref:Phage portal protein n=2 Tax=Novosphingobium umbonatum TaxID=1908524 RepID=A0A437N297_9SPHN|nr:phage portal protein [Novosphingobium umbonatum]